MATTDYTMAVANPTAIYNPITGSVGASTGAQDISSLATDSAQANLSNMPNIDKITQMVSDINQRAYLSAPGRQQQLSNIQTRASGQLDPDWLASAQSAAASRYGGAGFGVDSPAFNAAVLRASGLKTYDLQEQASKDLNELYSGMNQYDPSSLMVTPEIYSQYETGKAAEQAKRAALEQQDAEQRAELAEKTRQFNADLAFRQQAEAQSNALAREKMYAELFGKGGSLFSYNPWTNVGSVQGSTSVGSGSSFDAQDVARQQEAYRQAMAKDISSAMSALSSGASRYYGGLNYWS